MPPARVGVVDGDLAYPVAGLGVLGVRGEGEARGGCCGARDSDRGRELGTDGEGAGDGDGVDPELLRLA